MIVDTCAIKREFFNLQRRWTRHYFKVPTMDFVTLQYVDRR